MPILNWLGRDEALKTAAKTPYRLLEEVPELGYGDKSTDNMIVQGDNLEALKALLPFYAGQVKCIYIDPPYNTGSAFEHYDDNLEHSTWLSMMEPRLELLREFLSEDGAIFVSIDDNEQAYLRVIMDEIFGRNNFIATIAWQKFHSVKANSVHNISQSHEYIVVYAKNSENLLFNKVSMTEEAIKVYKNPDNDPRGLWRTAPLTVSLLSGARGKAYAKTGQSTGLYEIIAPNGTRHLPSKGRCWLSKENIDNMIKDNRIWWGKDGNAVPMQKIFLSEKGGMKVINTFWNHEEFGSNKKANEEIKQLFPNDMFSTPKPEELINKIIGIATNPNDLVLDSFLGSGTTAAVAQKMGRRYIGIEMGNHAITHCVPRLKAVVDGEQGGISKAINWQGGGGFRFYKLGNEVFDADGCINEGISFEDLSAHIWFTETKTPFNKPAEKSTFLGIKDNVAYALLYNGILKDKRVDGGNVLTNKTLKIILDDMQNAPYDKLVIYGESSRISQPRLKSLNIEFKQTPYDIKAR